MIDTWVEDYWHLKAVERKPRVWFAKDLDMSTVMSIGGDEYERKTFVLGTPLTGYMIIAYPWRCRCKEHRELHAELIKRVDEIDVDAH